jgi:heme exporter protein D
MNWKSIDDFMQMGGYGLYVWGSYVVTLVVMLAEAWAVRRRQGRALDSARAEAVAGVTR